MLSAKPGTAPIATTLAPSRSTRAMMSRPSAPSVDRIPISRSRCAIEYEITP
jgi:hypothetical protein